MTGQVSIAASPLCLELGWQEGLVRTISLSWQPEPTTPIPPLADSLHQELAKTLEHYVAGEAVRWPELPLDVSPLTPFARAVLTTLKDKVLFGQVVSYGHLAFMAGYPNAGRAVGRVMASSPFSLIIPCHRVVGANGSMVGYGSSGLALKRWLLRLEGVLKDGQDRIPKPTF